MVSEFRKISPNVLLIIFIIIFCISLFSKMWGLGDRVMHHDESLHSFYSWMFTKYVDILHLEIFGFKIPYYFTFGNGYEHNPMLHGPLQFEFNAFIFI